MIRMMPEGFDPGLFDELIDMVRHFGNPAREFAMMYLAVKAPRPMLFIISAEFGRRIIHIYGHHSELFCRGRWHAPLNEDGTDSCHVDVDLTPDDLLSTRICVDQVMREQGCVDADGRRHRAAYELSKKLFSRSVDLIFDDERPYLPNPHNRMSAAALDAIRGQYDRPGDLFIFTDGFGWPYLCLTKHRARIGREDAAFQRVFARRGITGWEQFERLMAEPGQTLTKEIYDELQKQPN